MSGNADSAPLRMANPFGRNGEARLGSLWVSGRLDHPQNVTDDLTSRISGDGRMSKQRSVVKWPREHVEQEFDVQTGSRFTTFSCPFERFTHGSAACCQNLSSNGRGEIRILRHICNEARQGLAQGPGKRLQEGANRRLQIPTNATGIWSGVIPHFADDGIRHQISLARPSTIDAGPRSANPPSNSINGHRPVSALFQCVQNSRHDLGIDPLVSRTSDEAVARLHRSAAPIRAVQAAGLWT